MASGYLHGYSEEMLFDLVERLDVRGPRYTSYPTAPVWSTDFPAERYPEALGKVGRDGRPVAVYMHLPYCRQRCFYCGCHSFISNDREKMCSYADSLKREISHVGEHLPTGARHAWLHLGGGTPTHLPDEELAGVLDHLESVLPGIQGGERSVEVDPRVTTDEALTLLADRGFRRISIGLQDLDPDVQNAVNREFSYEQIRDFTGRCRGIGFTSVNIDLIYGLPLQTRETWKRTLERVEGLRPDRV
ncbi:radical SAM protein, partial [bacterium]|nr:radical SAM protein [bacterium]